MSCAWNTQKVYMDCQKNQDKEYREMKCYMPKFSAKVKTNRELEPLIEEMNKRIQNKEVRADVHDNDDPKAMRRRMKKHCGRGKRDRRRWRSRGCRKAREIMNTFKEDLAHIYTLTTKVYGRLPYIPITGSIS